MALVILAHPDFSRSIANKAVITRLQHSGLPLEVRDLAALYPDYRIDPTAEQQALLRHHTVVFQYPLYWYNVPAILKQYFDCVLTYGFAYGTGGDQLRGKTSSPASRSVPLLKITAPTVLRISACRNCANRSNRPLTTRRCAISTRSTSTALPRPSTARKKSGSGRSIARQNW